MAPDAITVALWYLQSTALAIPLVALLLYRVVTFDQEIDRQAGDRQAGDRQAGDRQAGGFTGALADRSVDALTYSFLPLYATLVLSVLVVLLRTDAGFALTAASLALVAAFTTVFVGVVAFFVQFE